MVWCAILFFAVLGLGPAHALSGDATAERLVTYAPPLGADAINFDDVRQERDTVTIRSMDLVWHAAIGRPPYRADLLLRIPHAVFQGLSRVGDRVRADKIRATEARISVVRADGSSLWAITVRQLTLSAVSWEIGDKRRPLERLAGFAAKEMQLSVPSGFRLTARDIARGRIGWIGVGDAAKPSPAVHWSYATLEGIDLVALFSSLSAEPRAGSSRPFLRRGRVGPLSAVGTDGAAWSLGSLTVEGLAANGGIVSLLDSIATGSEPTSRTIETAVARTLCAMSAERIEATRLVARGDRDVALRVDTLTATGVHPDRSTTLAIEGASVRSATSAARLDRFEISRAVLPNYQRACTTRSAGLTRLAHLVALVPVIEAVSVEGLALQETASARVTLDRAELELSEHVGPFPTSAHWTASLSAPIGTPVDPPVVVRMLARHGIHELRIEESGSLRWRSDETLHVTSTSTYAHLGSLSLDLTLTGLPYAVLVRPSRLGEALSTLAAKQMTLTLADDGLVDTMMAVIEELAPTVAISGTDMALSFFARSVEPLVSAPDGGPAMPAFAAFLHEGGELVLSATPPKPVPVTQLMVAAMRAPAAIATLMRITLDHRN
ncbi:hypothetical protein [Acuticoccus mangrovi]|uniref:AsmA-like C-terminal domain-containing protein n=1 Tax=Acuticoccus mangrovi TaxID=2796142 RepID=A0A934IL58_9HYPH|nr:hypothetical protein [Acuticoccus mangrovi]MBJ3774366.1 hypothetical protein [Acuticoccus mangrovi]